MTAKEEFIKIFKENITREGSDKLLDWIETTDFFTAPASTRFHCACENGLVMHSVSVYNTMVEKHFDEETDSAESFAICALLHDLCKAQLYKVSTRNVKNDETGRWDRLDEAMAIRWHMGEFGDKNSNTISQAYNLYPLAVKLHLADLESTYLREKGTSAVNN